ncbi:MAG: ATP-binding protein, partial [Bacteroidia bacterium]|nr:ATP-binding protein [Bacteroidia bacterium]
MSGQDTYHTQGDHVGRNKIERQIEMGDGSTYNENRIYQSNDFIPKLLTPPPFQPPIFVGREAELQSVHDRLFSGDNFLMLVNGHGGIGKTTFASKYWDRYQDEYSHLAFLFVENGIANALLSLA